MIDRWTVRECPRHGPLTLEVTRSAGCCPFMGCIAELSDAFDVVRAAGARTADPDTSKLAALRQEPRSGSQRARIMDAVRTYGPMTAHEIGDVTGIDGAWKRISELVQGGHLAVGGTRTDPQTATEVQIYYRTDRRPPCPDGGVCHHSCTERCWRVSNCGPMSASGWRDWPEKIKQDHTEPVDTGPDPFDGSGDERRISLF